MAHPDGDLAQLLKEVRRIQVQSDRLVTGVMAGTYSSVFRGSGIEFEEVREYVPGDDPRALDWNVTARVGRPFVKTYVDERELSLLFLLDCSPSMDAGFGTESMRRVAARVCACLGLSAVKNNDRVGLVAFSSGVDHYLPPRSKTGHALRIVRDCLVRRPRGGGGGMGAALDFAARVSRKHSLLFLISDFLDRSWQTKLRRCARHHQVIAVRLLPPEVQPPERGIMRLHDPETGRERWVDWSHSPTREAYSHQVNAWLQETEREFRRARVDVLDIPCSPRGNRETVSRALLRFFRMRLLRGTRK